MRATYRDRDNLTYWADRWSSIPVDAPMRNASKYPLKYAEMVIQGKDGRILEAGCGMGRILRFYKDRGHAITGVDFVPSAIEKLKEADPALDVEVADVRKLRFADASFRTVLAFGLYHNFMGEDLEAAVRETFRVLEPGGRLCASFRADNLQTRLNDWLASRKERPAQPGNAVFHKLNLTKGELVELFRKAGFKVEQVLPVENMPIFYKFRAFRAKDHKEFDEALGRREGYRLSPVGGALQKLLVTAMPSQFCNVYVLIARK